MAIDQLSLRFHLLLLHLGQCSLPFPVPLPSSPSPTSFSPGLVSRCPYLPCRLPRSACRLLQPPGRAALAWGNALRLESSYEVEGSEAGSQGAEDRLQRPVRSP